MVNLKIDHNEISVPEGTTIMEAAALAGIDIPKLCYLKDINEIAAFRVCLMEVVDKENWQPPATTMYRRDWRS